MRFLLFTLLGCLLFSAAEAQQPSGAGLKLTETCYDFGDVHRRGGELVHEFAFTNNGTAPLVLTRVITSCSCLKASFSKRPVAPGASGVIRITYEPLKSEPGAFNKVIQIYSNTPSDRDVITVQGNSIDSADGKVVRRETRSAGREERLDSRGSRLENRESRLERKMDAATERKKTKIK